MNAIERVRPREPRDGRSIAFHDRHAPTRRASPKNTRRTAHGRARNEESASPRSSSRSSTRCSRARAKALAIIETYDQARVDRLCQAVAWAVANKQTFTRLVDMGIEESGLGDAVSRMGKRMKIRGVLRDALRQKSVGIIEELPEKGIVKYGKPAGIIACIVPTTNPDLTPAGNAIYGDQGARRRHLLAAPALEEDVVRDRAPDARGARARRRAGRHPAVPHQGQHPDVAGADGARRPDRRHRRPADGARGVQLRHAGVRRGRRQLDDDHRRDRQHRGSGAQHAAVQDLGLRLGLLGRRQPDHRGVDLRQAAGAAAEGRRLPRDRRRRRRRCARRCGTTSATAPPKPWRSRRSSSPRRPASRFPPTASSSSSTATASARSITSPARS